MNSRTLSVAVIVPTYRRGAYLVNTVYALLDQITKVDELLVIDQTPLDEYAVDVRRFLEKGAKDDEFRWLRLAEPGVSAARNCVILETDADVLLYLDDDIEPSDQLVDLHRRHYHDAAVHAVVGAVLLPKDRELVSPPLDFLNRSFVEQAFTYRTCFNTHMKRVGFMWGGNFSVRRRALIAVGGWDEHIVNYGDRDLGIRLATGDYRIDYDPEAAIVHLNAPMGGTRVTDPDTPWHGWQRCVSLFYLAFRHLRGSMFWRYGVYRAARFSILLKQNLLRPWRWPAEVHSFVKACCIARRWSLQGLRSPFVERSNGQSQEWRWKW